MVCVLLKTFARSTGKTGGSCGQRWKLPERKEKQLSSLEVAVLLKTKRSSFHHEDMLNLLWRYSILKSKMNPSFLCSKKTRWLLLFFYNLFSLLWMHFYRTMNLVFFLLSDQCIWALFVDLIYNMRRDCYPVTHTSSSMKLRLFASFCFVFQKKSSTYGLLHFVPVFWPQVPKEGLKQLMNITSLPSCDEAQLLTFLFPIHLYVHLHLGGSKATSLCFKIHTIVTVYGTVLKDTILACGKLLAT